MGDDNPEGSEPTTTDNAAAFGTEGDQPLSVIEDGDSGDRLLVYATEGGAQVELRVEGGSFWATQRQMAGAFGVTTQNVSMHLGNIFREGELSEAAVCKESLHTGPDGKRYTVKL